MRQLIEKYIGSVVRRQQDPRRQALAKIFEFVKYNQITGDYLEFGCGGAHTFRAAYDALTKIRRPDIHLYAFDSFQGLPTPVGVDIHPDFSEQQFAQSRVAFEQRLREHPIPTDRYTVIEGFYDRALTDELRQLVPVKAAAVVWVDCDLYASTVAVLKFIQPYLQTGTIVAFDDYYCFNGDPDRGEQKALYEFRQANPQFIFTSYFQFSWAGQAFICKKK